MEFSFAHSMIDCSSLSSTVREFHTTKCPLIPALHMFTLPRITAAASENPNSKHFLHVIFGSPLQPNFRALLCSSRSIASYNRTQPPFPPIHSLTLPVPRIPLQEREKKIGSRPRRTLSKHPSSRPLPSFLFLSLLMVLFLAFGYVERSCQTTLFNRSAAAFTLAQMDTSDRGGCEV
ncbi:hypothetical protein V8C44DRAFT_216814 [Trichoderma aethiopicum]